MTARSGASPDSIAAALIAAGFKLTRSGHGESVYLRGPEMVSVRGKGWQHDRDITTSPWSVATGQGAAELKELIVNK